MCGLARTWSAVAGSSSNACTAAQWVCQAATGSSSTDGPEGSSIAAPADRNPGSHWVRCRTISRATQPATGEGAFQRRVPRTRSVNRVAAFPDAHISINDIFGRGDQVVARVVVSGTQEGAIIGIPASGRHVQWDGVDIYRQSDGKISNIWAGDDWTAILNDTGTLQGTLDRLS